MELTPHNTESREDTSSRCRWTISDLDHFTRPGTRTNSEEGTKEVSFPLPFVDSTHSPEEIEHAVLLLVLRSH